MRGDDGDAHGADGLAVLRLRAGDTGRRNAHIGAEDIPDPLRHLVRDGFVLRYDTSHRASDTGEHVDGLPPGEGAFLACSYWLADVYVQQGRIADAERLFERLLGLANDVGLLAEEYDPGAGRLLGNFPQAFSHLSLVNTACNLAPAVTKPAEHRAGSGA